MPTVERVAAAASISRTTAYRYFPNQQALLVAAHPEIDVQSMLPEGAPEGAPARLDVVIRAFVQLILDTERPQRTMLRLSLEQDPTHHGELPLRKGERLAGSRKRWRPSAHGWLSPNCGGSSTR